MATLFVRRGVLEIAIVERGIDDRIALVDSAVVNRDFERDVGHLRNAPNMMAEKKAEIKCNVN